MNSTKSRSVSVMAIDSRTASQMLYLRMSWTNDYCSGISGPPVSVVMVLSVLQQYYIVGALYCSKQSIVRHGYAVAHGAIHHDRLLSNFTSAVSLIDRYFPSCHKYYRP